MQFSGATKQLKSDVYYRTPTLDGRLNLTDELVRTVLPIREKKRKVTTMKTFWLEKGTQRNHFITYNKK